MLIEFSLTNFRSFKERATFSMVSGTSKEVREKFSHETGFKTPPYVLKNSVILGPNGSGKTGLVQAVDLMTDMVLESAKGKQEGEPLEHSPYKLSAATRAADTEFEIIFIHQDTRFQYGFSFNAKRITGEWLYATPLGGRVQRWFERRTDLGADRGWYINPSLKGERDIWRKATRDNALFLSTAMQLNAESLRLPFEWFQQLIIIESSQRLAPYYTASLAKTEKRQNILLFFKEAGLDINDISIEEVEVNLKISEPLAIGGHDFSKKKFRQRVSFAHRGDDSEHVYLDISEESDGTQVLFSLIGPWITVLENGAILLVDELHNSLHPLALRYLVGLFNNPETNPHKAQLIFTTHDVSILSSDMVSADQVWLAERKAGEGSRLTPMSDFHVRQNEALEKGYMGGRYGGLPVIGRPLAPRGAAPQERKDDP